MNKKKIAHRVITGLFSAMMLMSVGMYLFNHGMVAETFESLGYPAALIYPLALAKLLGVVALWGPFPARLKTAAYAGFAIDFVLAVAAHISAGDGQAGGAIMAAALMAGSFFTRDS